MRAKGLFSGLLAVFLLAMASWSSACDLSCSLASRHLGCEVGQAAQPSQAAEATSSKMDMEDCSHADSLVSDERAAAAPSATTAPCLNEACRPIAVSAAAKRAAQSAQRNAARWTAMTLIQPAASSALFRRMERKYPPPKTAPVVLLSTSLRI
jgi:hypothetical protein